MGCDGGTIPRRDELVRLKKKPEQKDKDAERQFRWLHCSMTQERLQQPIVMCGLGRLYSKQNVIEQLLEKDKMPESCQHIKGMKDIKVLNLTSNPVFKDEDKSEGLLDTRHAPFICKLIGLEMSGKFRFLALWSCGCVFSERAFKEMKEIKSKICPLCQTTFTDDDVIILNGSDEDMDAMCTKMEARSVNRKSSKKSKKVVAAEAVAGTSKEETEIKIEPPTPSSSSSSAATAKPAKNKLATTKRVIGPGASLEDPEIKKLKTDFSVAKDPKATDVYKSLFTTHSSEQEQNRAHWVTYNPFYN